MSLNAPQTEHSAKKVVSPFITVGTKVSVLRSNAVWDKNWIVREMEPNSIVLLKEGLVKRIKPDLSSVYIRPDDSKKPAELNLSEAILSGNWNLINRVVSRDTDVNEPNEIISAENCTTKIAPLLLACEIGRIAAIRLLLVHGADLSAQDSHGDTALHISARRGDAEMAKTILECGAELSPQNGDGDTPLHLAARAGAAEVAKALIGRNCHLSLRNKKNQTALDISKSLNQPEIIALLSKPLSSGTDNTSGPLNSTLAGPNILSAETRTSPQPTKPLNAINKKDVPTANDNDKTERFLIGSNDNVFRPGTEPKTSAADSILPEKYFFTSAMPDFSLFPPRDEFQAPDLDLDSYGGRGVIRIPKDKTHKTAKSGKKSHKHLKNGGKSNKSGKNRDKKSSKQAEKPQRTIGDLVTPGGTKKGDFFYKKGSVEVKNRRFLSRLVAMESATSSSEETSSSSSSSNYSSSSSCSSCSRCDSRRRRHHRRGRDHRHHQKRRPRQSCSHHLDRSRRRGASLGLRRDERTPMGGERWRVEPERDREVPLRGRLRLNERREASFERRDGRSERNGGGSLWGDRPSFRDRAGGGFRGDRPGFDWAADRRREGVGFRDRRPGAGRDENRGGGNGFEATVRNVAWAPRFARSEAIVDSKYAGIGDFKRNEVVAAKDDGPPDLVRKRVERNTHLAHITDRIASLKLSDAEVSASQHRLNNADDEDSLTPGGPSADHNRAASPKAGALPPSVSKAEPKAKHLANSGLAGHMAAIAEANLAEKEPKTSANAAPKISIAAFGGSASELAAKQAKSGLAEVANEEEEVDRSCVICLERLKNVLFLPCKHVCCCKSCSAEMAACPICDLALEEKFDIVV